MKGLLIIFLLFIFFAETVSAEEGIIFARFHKGQSDLYFISLNGKGLIPIAADPLADDVFLKYAGDGRVVFTKRLKENADIYSIKIGDKSPTPLAVSADIEDIAGITSDKKRIVFHRRVGRMPLDLYAVGVDGSKSTVLAGGPFIEGFRALARDRVLYALTGKGLGSKLHSVGLDGKDNKLLLEFKGDTYFEKVTHDGRVVISAYPSSDPSKGSLYIVNPDGSGRAIISDDIGIGMAKSLSADNKLIYFKAGESTDNYYIVDLNEKELKSIQLTSGPGRKMFLASTTDNERMVFSVAKGNMENDFYTVKTDGTGKKALSKGPGLKSFRSLVSGNRVIYTTNIDGQRDVYVVKTDGTGLLALASSSDDEDFRGFSAESGRVLIVRLVDGKQWDLFSIKLDGTGLASIGKTEKHELPRRITPENKVIFVRNTAYRNVDLYIADPDGSNVTTLTNTEDDERFVSFAPGNRIIFMRISEGGAEEKKKIPEMRRKQGDLYIINSDGTGLIPLATTLDAEEFMYLVE